MNKKFIARVLTLLLACSVVWPVWAAGEFSDQGFVLNRGITMDVTYGYDDAAKGGRYIPVQVRLDNTEDKSFVGELQVLSMESDYDIYRYDYPVYIEAGGPLIKEINIPVGNRGNQLFINLMDQDDNQVIHKRVKLNVSLEVPELFVGILSDTPEKLAYFNGVGVDYSMLRTKTFTLNEKNFPTDKISLDLVDVILISNYKIRNLSAKQNQVLVDWVRDGGTMILGTGARVDDTLGRFAPELLDESYDAPEVRKIDMGQDYASDGPGSSVLEIPSAEFSLSGENILFSDDQLTLVSSVAYTKGTIAVAAYDFTDIEVFGQKNPSYVDSLLTSVLGEEKITRIAETSYSGNSTEYWSVNDMINTGNVSRLPNVSLYIAAIVIYILLVGPGLYLFLKKRELRKYYPTGISLLSLVFTMVIYLMGSKTRFVDTFYTYARFVNTSEDTITESVYLNIQTPYNNDFQVSLDSSYSVKPITRSYYDEGANSRKFTGEEDYKIAIEYAENETKIWAQNMKAFEPKYFLLDLVEENVNQIGFVGEILMDEGNLSGNITNSFEYLVEDTAVLLYDKLILLGDIQPGETKTLDNLEVLQCPLSHPNQIAEKITGGDQYRQPDITDKGYMESLARTNLLISYLEYSDTAYATSARVVGVSNQVRRSPLHSNSPEAIGLTVVSSSLPVYSAEEEVVYRSALVKKPAVISGNYDYTRNTLYGVDPLVLEYSLGNDVIIEKLFLDSVSESFIKTVKPSNLSSFIGNIYFYNYDTGIFDQMNQHQTVYTQEQLKSYLSPGNTMIVKYFYSDVSEYSWDILLPMVNIVGRGY